MINVVELNFYACSKGETGFASDSRNLLWKPALGF